MIKEAKATGATVEEARDKALLQLGATINDDVQYEVISRGKKKVLGLFGGAPAQVRVFIEIPDEKPRKKPNKTESRKAVKAERPAQAPAKSEKPQAEKPRKEKAKTESVAEDFANTVDVSELPENSPARGAVAYLMSVLKEFGCGSLTAKVAETERGAYISIEGENIGAAIGHRGETLDALQYLAGLAANSTNGYYKVSLNFGNYREKREKTLNSLAERVAKQVLASGKSRALEPMNPYERRIIHTAIQGMEGVISASVGEGTSRRVVVAPEGTEIRYNRRDDRRAPRGARGGRERRPSNTVATAPTREPKKDTDLPLYGKIN